MRICVLGKRRSVTGWLEATAAAWRDAGHAVLPVIFRDSRLHPALERALFSPRIGAPRTAALVRRVRTFAPDLIVAVDAFATPLSLLTELRATPGLPPLFGWVGDSFDETAIPQANAFSVVGYTDSGFLALHAKHGLRAEAFYLPHAANPMLAGNPAAAGPRNETMVFVANRTPHRLATLQQVREKLVLYGAGWQAMQGGIHEVHLHRVPVEGLGAIYRAHRAVLNIRNETHVLAGLNQRNFDPYLCGAVVVTDPQTDLERCFAPGTEVLVWHEAAEIDALASRLRQNPAWAAEIAERGRRRVLAEHTYAARLASFARHAGASAPTQTQALVSGNRPFPQDLVT